MPSVGRLLLTAFAVSALVAAIVTSIILVQRSKQIVRVSAVGQGTKSLTKAGYINYNPNATLSSITLKEGWSARLCADPADSTHNYIVLKGPLTSKTAYSVASIIVLQGNGAMQN